MALKLLLICLILATTTMEIVEGVFQGIPNGVSFNLFGIRVTLYCTLNGNMASRDTPPFRGKPDNQEIKYEIETSKQSHSSTIGSYESSR